MKDKCYIIASLGRCGSQLMTETIHKHVWGDVEYPKTFLKKTRPFIRSYPSDFKNGVVYKTHLYPTQYPKNCKVVFTFGNPIDIILSVIRKSKDPSWGYAHFQNLAANWQDFPKIMERDVLNLEKMFDAFYREQDFDLMCVRYETLWENEEKMSDFFETDFKMPIKQERVANEQRKNLTDLQIQTLENGYSSLIEKIKKAEDIKIWRNK